MNNKLMAKAEVKPVQEPVVEPVAPLVRKEWPEYLAATTVDLGLFLALAPVKLVYRVSTSLVRMVFAFWLTIFGKIMATVLPEIQVEDLQKTIHETSVLVEQKAAETIEPIIGHLKHAAIRLTIAGIIFTGILVSSMLIYSMIYFFTIPTLVQEAPVSFTVFRLEQKHTWEDVGYLASHALSAHVEIDSALTDYQRH